MIGITRRGRPPGIAELNYEVDTELDLRDKFYNACSSLNYGERVALARALNINPVTVAMWKYKMRFPRWYVATQVIDWVKHGKPIKRVPLQKDMF